MGPSTVVFEIVQ